MATDKTGAPTTVTLENDRFTIALDGQAVGEAVFTERGLQRIFLHTEVAADSKAVVWQQFSSARRSTRPRPTACASLRSARW